MLDAAQRRFSRARPGSVLIMVVALLVMLALIGTAAMSTARIDRVSAVQHTKNVQLDIFAEGVKNMAVSAIGGDLFNAANGNYRDVTTPNSTYDNYDYPGSDLDSNDGDSNYVDVSTRRLNRSYDGWLGSRLPEAPPGTNPDPFWRFVSFPPFPGTTGGYRVDSPQLGKPGEVDVNRRTKVAYTPTYLTFGGAPFPAFAPAFSGATNPFGKAEKFLAADADGDGIADSLLFKLGTVGNLTYYGAYRIIDNNSAINVNTAMLQSADFVASGNTFRETQNDAFFPSNVGMAEFLLDFNYKRGGKNDDPRLLGSEFPATLRRKNLAFAQLPYMPSGLVGGKGEPLADNGTIINTFKYRTLADAAYMGLGRRLDFPGCAYNQGGLNFYFGNGGTRPYGMSDAFSLAYRFCLGGPSVSQLESDLPRSTAPASFKAYSPNAGKAWYTQNFDYDASLKRTVRSVFVTYNPTSNAAPAHLTPALNQPLYPGMQATPQIPLKISLNTAFFEELWRGFYETMCTDTNTTGLGGDLIEARENDQYQNTQLKTYYGTGFTSPPPDTIPVAAGTKTKTPFPPNSGEFHTGRMFRSPIRNRGRNNRGREPSLTARQVMALRSALAAANTVSMRDGSEQVTPRRIQLVDPANNAKPYQAVVYGYARQPFITEVFAHTDVNKVNISNQSDPRAAYNGKTNPRGFMAIELYNPYDEDINLNDFQLAIMRRDNYPHTLEFLRDGDGTANGKQIVDALKGVVIKPQQYIVLHNWKQGAGDGDTERPAQYWPRTAVQPNTPNGPQNVPMIYVPGLTSVLPAASNEWKELVLLRPVPGGKAGDLYQMAPVDSFDFTGLVLPPDPGTGPATTPQPAEAWHYTRANAPGKEWAFVYPGRYDGSQSSRRHQGTQAEAWTPGTLDANKMPVDEPWSPLGVPKDDILLGVRDDFSTRNPDQSKNPNNANNNNNAGVVKDFQIQLAGTDVPGMGAPGTSGAGAATFPYGGFARVGDLLQVPFIGAYTIYDATGNAPPDQNNLQEMNAITMDSVFAEDTDVADDAVEDIGRFCPVTTTDLTKDPLKVDPNDPASKPDVNDYDPRGAYRVREGQKPPKPLWHYRWSMRLFDYFTAINNPDEDYLPNIGQPGGGGAPSPPAMAVPNGPNITDPKQANGENERTAPVEGLININTAGWRVLAAIPFASPRSGDPDGWNRIVAKSIVRYRDEIDPVTGRPHGAFTSLYELNCVPIYDNNGFVCYFQDLWRKSAGLSDGADADDDDGDFSPARNGTTDDVLGDFEEKLLSVNRISNLVTLRSDCYTAYILVQAWSNAGSAAPTLEGQRRLAVIVDRSRVTPQNKTPTVFNVPTSD
jgi:hypothetical protein